MRRKIYLLKGNTMPKKSARTTTALVATMSMLLPQSVWVAPVQAQETVQLCLDLTDPPCPEGQPTEGTTMDAAAAAAALQDAADAAAAQAQAEADAATQAAAEADAAAAALAEADAAATAQAQADADAAIAAQAQAEADAAAAADAAASAQADADAAAAALANADADAAAAAQAQADADAAAAAQAQHDADAAAAADQAAADQAAADQAAADQAAADQAAANQAAADQAAANQAAADQAAADQAATDQAAADQAQHDADAAATGQAQADADAANVADQAAADQAAVDQAAADQAAVDQAAVDQAAADQAAADQAATDQAAADAETAPDVVPLVETADVLAEDEATRAAAQQAIADGADPTVHSDAGTPETPVAAADATATTTADVQETVVTQEEVRSSDQDFAAPVTLEATAAPAAEASRRGLSNFEKALLIGVGAVAVGALLKNGDRVVANSGDRIVTRGDNGYTVYRDDDALLRQPGMGERTETFNDGSTRTTLTRTDGSQIVTIKDAQGRVLRRARVLTDGTQVQLFDDVTVAPTPVDVRTLPKPYVSTMSIADADRAALRRALNAQALDRSFSLRQIREIAQVREQVQGIDLDTLQFPSGSAAIPPEATRSLVRLGVLIEEFLAENPREVFLIEGHTDATGSEALNLALSDRRAESVALALTENFNIPPENLVVQGYGEQFLKVNTQASEPRNRRATVRRITPLLAQVASR